MQRAILELSIMPIEVYIDGQYCPVLPSHYKTTAIIRGDSLVPAISAASILAKVSRDREMCILDFQYPGYGFAIHKGYPTARHLEQLQRLGPCDIHRKTFGPVVAVLH
jgi:ribonuclease HII